MGQETYGNEFKLKFVERGSQIEIDLGEVSKLIETAKNQCPGLYEAMMQALKNMPLPKESEIEIVHY